MTDNENLKRIMSDRENFKQSEAQANKKSRRKLDIIEITFISVMLAISIISSVWYYS